jgi:hypothetical protein
MEESGRDTGELKKGITQSSARALGTGECDPKCRWHSKNDVELTLGRGNAEILRQCKSFLEAGHVRWRSLKCVLVMLKREPWSLGLLEAPRTPCQTSRAFDNHRVPEHAVPAVTIQRFELFYVFLDGEIDPAKDLGRR